jgi:Flp pilus assembly pilin Flp
MQNLFARLHVAALNARDALDARDEEGQTMVEYVAIGAVAVVAAVALGAVFTPAINDKLTAVINKIP